MTPPPTPAPIPIFALVDRPPESFACEVGVEEALVIGDVLVGGVVVGGARALLRDLTAAL